MLQFIFCYSYYIICVVGSFSFIADRKIFVDDCLDTGFLLLRAICMVTVERFYMQVLLEWLASATAVTATEAIFVQFFERF